MLCKKDFTHNVLSHRPDGIYENGWDGWDSFQKKVRSLQKKSYFPILGFFNTIKTMILLVISFVGW